MWRHRLANDVVQIKTVRFQTFLLLLMETFQIVDGCTCSPRAHRDKDGGCFKSGLTTSTYSSKSYKLVGDQLASSGWMKFSKWSSWCDMEDANVITENAQLWTLKANRSLFFHTNYRWPRQSACNQCKSKEAYCAAPTFQPPATTRQPVVDTLY